MNNNNGLFVQIVCCCVGIVLMLLITGSTGFCVALVFNLFGFILRTLIDSE